MTTTPEMSPTSGTTEPPRATRREWIGLAVLALPTLMVSFDIFVLLLALPQLSADLSATSAQQLWIMDIYGFLVGGFLITMGNLGDRFGRRRMLLLGASVFAVASILAAYSTSAEMLIAARALLGIAGATLAPSTLSLITTLFRDPRQLGFAIGVWAGSFTAGAILGPVIGGVMLEYFWWGSVFLLGVPAVLLLLLVGPRVLPEFRDPTAGRIDLTSVLLSLGAILPFVYGVKELARHGWALGPTAALALGVGMGVLFLRRQRGLTDPMLDLSLFRIGAFRVSLLSLLAYSSLTGATLLFMTQYLQSVAGLSPLDAGLAMIPGLATGMVSVTVAPILARRIRPAVLIAAGILAVVAGLVILAMVGPESGVGLVILGNTVWCLGGGPLLALSTGLVVSSAPPEKAGAASALPQISNELGSALGMATLGSLGGLVYRVGVSDDMPDGLTPGVADAVRESLARATAEATSLPDAAALLSAARSAFSDGFAVVAGISAVLLALLTIPVLRGRG
ncbi:major facilitator superfamily MFS_1 [Alloactinosynnema sp. L-07]|uniref:MFS transporter n=1 Tax=Alloactinosynnema sp. L-07 TaxID=1653480 RepID=UPI00065EFA20|nr:MFS transporter [Alloactinosynnema sp. L-07]CRK59446.1 major facilitator superfamily MFS_1 [Alloactinosynnema sp. L-07]